MDMVEVLWELYDVQPQELKIRSLDTANYAQIMLKQLVKLQTSEEKAEMLKRRLPYIHKAMLYYDIGTTAIPGCVIEKSKVSDMDEWEFVFQHTRLGAKLLIEHVKKNCECSWKWNDFFNVALDIILLHHERWDGGGYPFGLEGENIPICARICAIADSYNRMRSERAYRAPKSHHEACNAIMNQSGKQFDPTLVSLFREFNQEFASYADNCGEMNPLRFDASVS